MEAINITAYPTDVAQIEAIKSVLKAFKIPFELSNHKPYNPDFIAKVQKSEQQFDEGNFISLKQDDLIQFLGL